MVREGDRQEDEDADEDFQDGPETGEGKEGLHQGYDDAHGGGGQAWAQDPVQPVEPHLRMATGEEQIGDHGDGIADDGGDGASVNIDARGADEGIVEDDFADYAGDHGIHGDALLMESLEDAAGGLDDGEEHHGQGREGQELRGGLEPLRGKGFQIKEGQDRLRQDAHANGAGEADEEGITDARIALGADGRLILHGLDGGDGRDQAHGNRQRQGGGNIDEPDDHAGKDAVEGSGRVPGQAGIHHAIDHDGGINEGGKGNDAGADGDGDGDQNQPPDQGSPGGGRLQGLLGNGVKGRAAAEIADDHIQQGQTLHQGIAQEGAGRAIRHGAAHAQGGQGQGNQHMTDLLNDLGNGRGHHILLALDKAAEGGEGTDQSDAGSDDPEAAGGLLHPDEADQEAIGEEHEQGKEDADAHQHGQGQAKNPLRAAGISLGQEMGHHAGDGHGETGAGNGEQQIIGRKNRLEEAETGVSQNAGQGNGIQNADDLIDDAGDAKDGNAFGNGFCLRGHEKNLRDTETVQMAASRRPKTGQDPNQYLCQAERVKRKNMGRSSRRPKSMRRESTSFSKMP